MNSIFCDKVPLINFIDDAQTTFTEMEVDHLETDIHSRERTVQFLPVSVMFSVFFQIIVFSHISAKDLARISTIRT